MSSPGAFATKTHIRAAASGGAVFALITKDPQLARIEYSSGTTVTGHRQSAQHRLRAPARIGRTGIGQADDPAATHKRRQGARIKPNTLPRQNR